MIRYFAMVGLLFVSKTNGGVENRQIRIPLTLPSPSLGARVQKVYLSPQGRGRGEGRRLRELRPDDHARARAPGEGRHVGEHLGRALGESHGEYPGDQLRRAPRTCFLHALEGALAQERLVIAFLEEIQEPEVELLVHPEVAGSTWLVGEAARGEDGDAL